MRALALLLILALFCFAACAEDATEKQLRKLNPTSEEFAQIVKDVNRRLEKKVTLQYVDTPFVDLLQLLNGLIKVSVTIDPTVFETEKIKALVAVDLKNVPASKALDEICKQAGLRWELKPTIHIVLPDDKKE